MSNYPPGVTGNEFAIAGPDHEYEKADWCPQCDTTRSGADIGYHGGWWWQCDHCDWWKPIPSYDDPGE